MASNEPQGRYGLVARILHWAMAAAIALQLVLGYGIDRLDDLTEWVVDGLFGGNDGIVVVAHLVLGVLIFALAVVRLAWRKIAGLPDWAPGLSERERLLAGRVEKVLYAAMFLIPVTGIGLVLLSGEDWDLVRGTWVAPLDVIDDDVLLGAHIATHVAFFIALALHVGLILKHQLVDRDRILRRML